MDEMIKKIKTSKECEIFAKNAINKNRPDLAKQAKQRAIEIKAENFNAKNNAEREAIAAVYAYEEVLTLKNKRPTKASRTWPMIKKYGIIQAVERAVNRETETQGYNYLLEMGLQEYAFEAVVLRYPEFFSDECIEISKKRINEWSISIN
jgi:hypothetical protein